MKEFFIFETICETHLLLVRPYLVLLLLIPFCLSAGALPRSHHCCKSLWVRDG